MPSEVQILQDHPNKTLEAKHLECENWFDMLKISQKKYLSKAQEVQAATTSSVNQTSDNLTISNKLKGILAMQFDSATKTIRVVENPWRQSVAEFNGAFVTKKFHK